MYDKIKAYAAALLLATLAACASDDGIGTDGSSPAYGEDVTVTVRLSSPTRTAGTRTTATYNDQYSWDSSEWMNSWFVVIVKENGDIAKIIESGTGMTAPSEEDSFEAKLATGTYHFYSFANMSLSDVGLENSRTSITINDFDANTLAVNGNSAYAYTDSTSCAQKSIPEGGIPMSNKQTIVVTSSGQAIDLWVVRMWAKMQLQLTNASSSGISLESVTLSDVTSNGNENANLYLFPLEQGGTSVGTSTYLSDYSTTLQPNLVTDATSGSHIWTFPTTDDAAETSVALTDDAAETSVPLPTNEKIPVCFYLNESQCATAKTTAETTADETTDGETGDGHFKLTLALKKDNGATVKETSADLTEWSYIARNDYRIVPIKIGSSLYTMKFEVYEYTAIGVAGTYTTSEDQLQLTTYVPGVLFHVVPTLYDSDGETVYTYSSLSASETPADIFENSPQWVEGTEAHGDCIEFQVNGTAGTAKYGLTVTVGDKSYTYNITITNSPYSYSGSASNAPAHGGTVEKTWRKVTRE